MRKYQANKNKINSKARLKNRLQEIQVLEGKQISQLKFPTKILEGILQLLSENNYQIQKIDQKQTEAKNFLRQVTPFMINAFISYLKTNIKYKKILKDIQILKKQKESKQQKFELKDLRYLLIQEKSHVRAFKQAFQTFLQSSFLQEYIQNNQKISNYENKQLYLKSIQLFLEEIEKKQIFVNFISDTNAKKIVKYSKYIMKIQTAGNKKQSQEEEDQNFQNLNHSELSFSKDDDQHGLESIMMAYSY